MTPQEMEARIVRYGDLRPCRTAFIDAHTPGSDRVIGVGPVAGRKTLKVMPSSLLGESHARYRASHAGE